LPKLLPDTDVPAEIFFRVQIRVVAENLVLTAGRTEPRRNARVQRRVRLFDLVTACNTIGPHATELVEMVEPAASDKDQTLDWCQRRLRKARDLLCAAPETPRLRPRRA